MPLQADDQFENIQFVNAGEDYVSMTARPTSMIVLVILSEEKGLPTAVFLAADLAKNPFSKPAVGRFFTFSGRTRMTCP